MKSESSMGAVVALTTSNQSGVSPAATSLTTRMRSDAASTSGMSIGGAVSALASGCVDESACGVAALLQAARSKRETRMWHLVDVERSGDGDDEGERGGGPR